MINAMKCPILGFRTASYGLSTIRQDDTLNSIVDRADKALLSAKKGGKNRIELTL